MGTLHHRQNVAPLVGRRVALLEVELHGDAGLASQVGDPGVFTLHFVVDAGHLEQPVPGFFDGMANAKQLGAAGERAGHQVAGF